MPFRTSVRLSAAVGAISCTAAAAPWPVPRPAATPAATTAAVTAGVEAPRKTCVINDPRIPESSGLAASRRHPGIVYTFNDSGGAPELYALGPDCRVRATLTLAGARNRDWEAMAIGRDGLYVGDIGDNAGGRPYVTVYRIPEPAVLASRTLRSTAYRIRYADGPRDAETMMIDPRSNRLYIADKAFGGSLYEGPSRLHTGRLTVMRRVGDAPLYATDGAFSPDGRTFVIRGYWDAVIYSASRTELARVVVPHQKQGEGVTYSADGGSLLFGSEGLGQPLWRVPLPEEARPPRPGATARPAPATRPSRGGGMGTKTLGVLAVGGLVLAGVVVFARRRAS